MICVLVCLSSSKKSSPIKVWLYTFLLIMSKSIYPCVCPVLKTAAQLKCDFTLFADNEQKHLYQCVCPVPRTVVQLNCGIKKWSDAEHFLWRSLDQKLSAFDLSVVLRYVRIKTALFSISTFYQEREFVKFVVVLFTLEKICLVFFI